MTEMSTSMQASSLAYIDTTYSADSIECCPFPGFHDLFVCGTYQIIKPEEKPAVEKPEATREDGESSDEEEEEEVPKQTQRVGRLLLFQIRDEKHLEELQRIETPAILDTKWSPRLEEGKPTLAMADAKGHVTIYTLDPEKRRLEETQVIDVADETTLCLSLDYSHRLDPSTPPSIVTSLSNGSLAHLTPSPEGYEVASTWHAHDFEPWITAFDLQDPNTVWSGGDDCKLKRWDLRDTSMPTFVNKNFDAGVTTITPSPYTPHLLAVGSYDESLRLFDTRSPRQPLSTLPLGGGIWRTRWHPSPSRSSNLLIASMHDGFKVVQLGEGTLRLEGEKGEGEGGEVVTRFEGHESLAYGADWSRLPGRGGGGSLVVTCSFYDHAMHLWRG